LNTFQNTPFLFAHAKISETTDSRVLLQLPSDYNKGYFATGHEIQINGVTSILDPAGNPLTVGTPLKLKVP